jgi:hypothetical protein
MRPFELKMIDAACMVLLASVAAFALTVDAKPSVNVTYAGDDREHVIVRSDRKIESVELEKIELSFRIENPGEKLRYVHRDKTLAVYIIEKE